MARSKSRVDNQLRPLRFKHNEMTQDQLAQKIGVSRQTIIAIEQGRFCPSLESALRIAKIFNTPVEKIFILQEGNKKIPG